MMIMLRNVLVIICISYLLLYLIKEHVVESPFLMRKLKNAFVDTISWYEITYLTFATHSPDKSAIAPLS